MSFQGLLDSLSKKAGSLYTITLPNGIDVSFRLPTVKESLQYKLLLDNALNDFHKYLVYEHLFNTYTEDNLLKENDDLHAGVVETVGGLIFYLCGTDNNYEDYTEQLLSYYRQSSNTLLNFFRRSICQVFPAYKFSDLDNLDYQDLILLYTQAEPALIQQGIIEKEITLKQEEVKQVSISEMIKKDRKEYENWDHGDTQMPNINQMRESQEQSPQIVEKQEKQRQALEKIKKARTSRGR
jgi:hypothetical protein